MKYGELKMFAEGLKEVSELRGVKFAIAVVKNAKSVDAEIEALNSAIPQPSKRFSTFLSKSEDIRKRYQNALDDEKDAINNEFIELQKTYEKDIKERNDEEAEFLETEASFNIVKVDVEDIPEDVSALMLHKISAMIND